MASFTFVVIPDSNVLIFQFKLYPEDYNSLLTLRVGAQNLHCQLVYYMEFYNSLEPFSGFSLIQFAKSQEFSNVWALQIFECKVLLSVLNSRTSFKRDKNQNL